MYAEGELACLPFLAVESKMVRQLLQYLTYKQGRKFNDPSSVRHIMSFIQYHSINIEEILLNVSEFKTFNEFFYRKLKPGVRTLCTSDPVWLFISHMHIYVFVMSEHLLTIAWLVLFFSKWQ